jgi:S-adenosylmethionine hydrolase
MPFEEVGEPIAVDALTTLELPRAYARDGALHAHALLVDRFGNVTLDASPEQLAHVAAPRDAELAVRSAAGPADRAPALARYRRTFGEVPPGELVLHEDSRGMLALAVNRGSAATLLGVGVGDEVVLRPR